ncbi:MAG: hypothetical protein LBV47_03295 [Bacteroidales bacterium]|nr:hypothetical protein [Bacteroidales bacterium]
MKKIYILLSIAFSTASCNDFVEERPVTTEDSAIETRAAEVGSTDY